MWRAPFYPAFYREPANVFAIQGSADQKKMKEWILTRYEVKLLMLQLKSLNHGILSKGERLFPDSVMKPK